MDAHGAEISHNRLGRSLIEAMAILRVIHSQDSTTLIKYLNVQLSRALIEYAKMKYLSDEHPDRRIEEDVHLATTLLTKRLRSQGKR